jgi:protein-tyrosine phosphatase
LIDVHCHILPALDDGALDLDDAIEMARQAADDGVHTVCATPHIRHDHDVVIAELPRRVGELRAELRLRGVAVDVLTGGEVAQSAACGLSDAELAAVSLGGGGRWILLEPAPGPLGPSLRRTVDELYRRKFRSVIAHPERHFHPDLEKQLADLVRRGALVQITAAYLEDDQTAPLLATMAERGLVHLLGSDAHSSLAGRAVRLSGGFRALRTIPAIEPHIQWLAVDAPRAVLAGSDVEPPFPAAV